MPNFSNKSRIRLRECHADIQAVMNEAIKQIDFVVLCGARSLIDQQKAFAEGKSKCDGVHNKSKHQVNPDGTSHAIDIAPFPLDWADIDAFNELARVVMDIADEMYNLGEIKHKLIWGGTFKSLVDRPHFELSD